MKTNNNPQTERKAMSKAELATLTEKVEMSQTYRHSYFLLLTKMRKNGKNWEKADRMIMSERKTIEECMTDKDRYEALADMYGRKAGMVTTFSIHNIFDRYDLWLDGKGAPNARAQQWADIKAAVQA